MNAITYTIEFGPSVSAAVKLLAGTWLVVGFFRMFGGSK